MATTTQTIRSPSARSSPARRTTYASGSALKSAPIPESERSVHSYASSYFDKVTVTFLDGSRWLIEKPTSHLELERSYSPSEAKQTFSAVCIKSMSGAHRQGAEAMIKIIYQIHASEDTIDSYQDEIDMYKKENPRTPETQAQLDDVQESLDQCTKPAPLPSKYTVDDMSALTEFYKHRT